MELRNKLTMCRLCLCENECFINIFQLNDWQGYVAAEVISNLLQFQVLEMDGYPHVVCSTCLVKLTEFKLFKECCEKSKVIYDNMLVSSESLVKHQSEMACSRPFATEEDKSHEKGPIKAINDPDVTDGNEFEVEPMEEEQGNEIDPEKGVGTSKGRLECDHGKKVLMTKGGLRKHMKAHGIGKSFNCEKEEERETAPEKVFERRKNCFECDHCKKVLMTKQGLDLHLATHGFGKVFECSVCCRNYVTKSALINHLHTHSNEKPYKCEKCTSRFARVSCLKNHMNVHSELKPYQCQVCNANFRLKSALTSHMTLHSGRRLFKCGVCSKEFAHSYTLRRHLVVHTGDRPFICEECNSRFNQKSALKTHMLIHLKLKPYQCEVCHLNFRHNATLTFHMRSHLGDRAVQM